MSAKEHRRTIRTSVIGPGKRNCGTRSVSTVAFDEPSATSSMLPTVPLFYQLQGNRVFGMDSSWAVSFVAGSIVARI